MALGKRLINTGGEAVCTTDTADKFGDGNGKALYTFDYDGSDESANDYHLTPTAAFFGVGGYINNGLRGGQSTSMMANTSIGFNYSSITVSFWAKLVGTGSTRFNFNRDGSRRFAFMRINYSSSDSQYSADLFTRTGTTSGTNTLVAHTLIDTSLNGSWIHLAMRMGDTLEDSIRNGIYINGTKATMIYSVGSATSSAGVDDAAPNRFYIGHYFDNALQEPFSIDIDHLRIFDRALTASEIGQLAAETACVHTSTTDIVDFPVTNVAYYKLDNSAEDSKGTNDGTETDIEYRFGRYGQAAVFNGSSSRINLPVGLGTTGARSNSLWIKVDTFPSSSIETFFYIGTQGANENYETISVSSTSKVKFQQRVGSATDMTAIESNETIIAGNWYHVATTHDGTTAKLYINGDLTKGGSVSFSSYVNNSSLAGNLGAFHTLTPSFDGSIDQYRRFHTDLSASQVSQLYNEKPETDTSNFKTVLYEGTSANQYISNVGMDLETSGGLVWVKDRDGTLSHILTDSVRGVSKAIFSDGTFTEDTSGIYFDSFEANGFFVKSANGTNKNNNSFVSWVWKGGGTAVSNTDGANINSSVSANTAAGFSIVTYTGTGNGNVTSDTVGHGLSSTPDIVMIKRRNGNDNWQIQANIDGTYKSGGFSTGAFSVASPTPVADPTSTVFNPFFSNLSATYVAYLWHSVSGYSKIGTYEGNGTTATTTINTDFEPSWVMIKRTDSANSWRIFDTRRDTTPLNLILDADTSNAESNGGTTTSINITSTGFNMSTSQFGGSINTDGGQYLYMAFK